MKKLVILLLVHIVFVQSTRQKRQLSLDDIISGALSLVRPIFDTSKPIQNEAMLRKPDIPTQDDMRDTSILGAHSRTVLDDVPFCKGNSGICRFISCSAENFKKDPTFGNIQLAAQVLGDAKLRKTISSNPEAVTAVCKEQGMDDSQCKLFSKGFQVIDKFLTTIEKPADNKNAGGSPPATESISSTSAPEMLQPQMDDAFVTKEDENLKRWADYDVHAPEPVIAQHSVLGSKTWSSNPETRSLQPLEVRNDLVSSWTPIPFFAPPTIPPAPPLAFKTVPSLILQPIRVPNLENGLFFSTDKFNFNKGGNSIKRLKRSPDYYDQVSETKKPKASPPKTKPSDSDDYYGAFDGDEDEENENNSPGLKQCVNLLGIGK